MAFNNAMEVLGALIQAYYEERDIEATLACVTEDIEWVGTENNDSANGKEALRALLQADVEAFPDSFAVELGEPLVQQCGREVVLVTVVGEQVAEPGKVAGFAIRGTACIVKRDEGWLIANLHVSVPNTAIEKYSLEKELDLNRKKERLLLSGIPGGVAIYRLKKDGHVQTDFVSDGFAKISGFGSGKELCRFLKNNPFVTVFEEDTKKILEAAKQSVANHQPVSIMYHAYAKNGDVILQRMDANIMDVELAEDELAVWYAVHTIVSEESKQILLDQKAMHKLIDDVPTGIGIYEVVNGKIRQNYVNDAFYRMLGSDRESRNKYFGENTMDAVHPDDKPAIFKAIQKAFSDGKLDTVDYRLALEDDKWFWVHLVGSVVERRPGYIRIYAAISDYNAVKEREQHFEELLRLNRAASADALSAVHINLSKKKVLSVNATSEDYKAHEQFSDADAFLASIKTERIDADEIEKFQCVADCATIIAAYKKGISHYEIMLHLRDTCWTKVTYDVLENAYTGDIEMISSIHDVTDQVRSELVVNKLMEIAYKSILLVDNKTGIATPYKVDAKEDVVYEINAKMGQTGEQSKGLEAFFRAYCLPDKAEEVIRENSPETIAKMLDRYPYYECMYTLCENGKLSQYKVTYSYLEEDKRILLSAVQDVTKVYEKEMQQSRRLALALAEADAANKAKTDFLSRVSHDMRTPLNGILGLTALLKDTVTDSASLRDLGELEVSGRYLLELINDTLDISRIENGKMELHPTVCDGRMLFNNALRLATVNAKSKNIKINVAAPDLPFTLLYVDVGRLEQVVLNVVGNAIKFTPEGGTIDITMTNVSMVDGIITDKLVIADNGIGMSKEFLPHIFEAFSQADTSKTSSSQGTGLGMAITKQLLQLMGGDITAESELGKGSIFTILLKLPVATDEQRKEWNNSCPGNDKSTDLANKRVLLCEDHPLNAKIAIRLLETKGVAVEHAENGQIGVEMFRESAVGYYDAVLMDIRMPVLDGIEAAKAIRKLPRPDARTTPILAMTANAFAEDVEQTRKAGMDAHLSKPIQPELLYETLAKVLDVKHQEKRQKILIVDDVEVNRELIRLSLEEDYEILEAESGQKALEIIENTRGLDAMITDIQMPEMDGFELIRRIRNDNKNRHLVIIANTQFGDPEQEEKLLELGANDFVYKPTTPKIVEIRVRNVLKRS